jgi:hypothetical protein
MTVSKKIALILTSGVLLAACGSSSNNNQASSGNGKKGYSQALAFVKCMRQHGVSNMPDPSSSGGGTGIHLSQLSGAPSPALKSAQQACMHLLPNGGPGSGPRSAQAHAQLLQVSECMRAHGFTDFPDPTTSPPSLGTPGYSVVMGHGGYFLAIPSSIDVSSPAFRQAASTCNFGPKGGPKGP